jgi:hypothetical protein
VEDYDNHYRIQETLGKTPITLGKGHSASISSAKMFLPSAFCRALGKEKHSAKCKSEKIQKNETGKKIIGGGMHSQPVTHLMGCTFFQQLFIICR